MSDPSSPHDAFPQSWETFWKTVDGEQVAYGRTDDGKEFKLDAGSPEPVEGRCNAPLRDYLRRYGEKRYCTRLSANKFPGYDSDYCKTHLSMEDLEDRWQELFKHGYFAESYLNVARFLSPTKFLFAVEMFGGLLDMSEHDFDVNHKSVALDVSDSALIHEDVAAVEMPIPTKNMFQADQLWQGALAEVEMRQMREVVFEEGVSKETYADTADVDGEITDTLVEKTEHHLHLPISRLTKDIKEHLQNGGVDINADDDAVVTFQKNDYTLDVTPEDTDEGKEVSDVGEEFSETLATDDEEAIISE